MELFVTRTGDRDAVPRIALLHGLLGQGKNLATVAKAVQSNDPGILYDLPNHGRSPWTETFDYVEWADLVADDLRRRLPPGEPITVLGHSMGGKIAMILALRHPDLVRGLVVLDMAPVDTRGVETFLPLIDALRSIDLTRVHFREDADRTIADQVPETSVRAFLLQNLHRGENGWRWLPNLDLLADSLDAIGAWPDGVGGPVDTPVLWMRGGRSNYVTQASRPVMRSYFPRASLVTLRGVGHWVHAEDPRSVIEAVDLFLARVDEGDGVISR